jgi:hypothetical protein
LSSHMFYKLAKIFPSKAILQTNDLSYQKPLAHLRIKSLIDGDQPLGNFFYYFLFNLTQTFEPFNLLTTS